MTPNYSYLDADGWVRQWSLEARPDVLEDGSLGPWQATPVAGLQIDLLPEGFAAKRNLRKVNGTYTDMTPTDPAPSSSCELQQSGEVLVWVETVSLADWQAKVWEKIKSERDGPRTEGGVAVGAHWFHTDNASRVKWLGLKDTARDMLAAGGLSTDQIVVDGEAVAWKSMSGAFVAVTVQLALDVVEATKVLDKRLFKNAEQHHAGMMAAAIPASYDYSTGWPQVYADTLQA